MLRWQTWLPWRSSAKNIPGLLMVNSRFGSSASTSAIKRGREGNRGAAHKSANLAAHGGNHHGVGKRAIVPRVVELVRTPASKMVQAVTNPAGWTRLERDGPA